MKSQGIPWWLGPVALVAALSLSACGDSSRPRSEGSASSSGGPVIDTALTDAAGFSAPAGNAATTTSATVNGRSGAILPSGRWITPAGSEISVRAPKPHALAISPDGSKLLTVNLMGLNAQGIIPLSATLISGANGASPVATLTSIISTYNGGVFSKDGGRFYVAGGEFGLVWFGDSSTGQITGSVNLSGSAHPVQAPTSPTDGTLYARGYHGAFPGKMTLSPDGRYLYVVDQGAFKLHVIDTTLLTASTLPNVITEPNNFAAVVASLPTGHYPYAVEVSPDGKRLYVANIGIFKYTHLRPVSPTGVAADDYPLCYPGAGYPDETAKARTLTLKPVDANKLPATLREPGAIRCGYLTAERSFTVPAAGDPNAPESSSIYVYDAAAPAKPVLSKVVKSGARIGEMEDGYATYGGSHPNSLAVGARAIYVANGNHDTISVLNPASLTEAARIPLSAFTGSDVIRKGMLPSELALSADGSKLYVAEAGINAIAVIALGSAGGLDGSAKVLGHIPTGWWPSAIKISPDGKTLYVANAKGRGAGPSSAAANYQLAAQSPKNTTIGTVNRIAIPNAAELAAYTQQVLRNNGFVPGTVSSAASPIPALFGTRSGQIKHVILLNKENSTHDVLLGHITQTRSGMAVAGMPANSVGQSVVPNHTELALQFAFSDNFYLDPVSSSEGHRWLQGYYATEFEETHWPTAYAQARTDSGNDPEIIANFPGRVGFSGVDESAEPIDYNKHGGVFLHLARNGRTLMNFGNGTELAIVDEGSATLAPTGTAEHVNIPMESVLRNNSDHLYAGFNVHIPDSPLPNDPARYNRFDRFKQIFESQLVVNGECRLADYTTLYFPNDHAAGPTDIDPTNAWSYQRYVQDNDAALGLSIDLISHSPCWKDTVIFVLEDDTQNGVDHVDGHRSLLMAISPWAKRQYVSHVHTSLPSVFKTIYLLLGVPPLNQFDTAATDLRDLFTATPDYTPYVFQPITYLDARASPAAAQAATLWARLTRGVNFDAADADEVNLRSAIIQQLGLPRRGALPLHLENPALYQFSGLKNLQERLRRYGLRSAPELCPRAGVCRAVG